MKALVIGSGSLGGLEFLKERCREADLIVAADGGARHLFNAGLSPHILVGDLDSIPSDVLDFYTGKNNVEICRFPQDKDFTDMELAMDAAAKKGADEISILAATGTRLDHSVANILLLYGLVKRNIRCCLEDEHNKVFLTDRGIRLKKQENWKVSLLSISSVVRKVTTSGLMYPLRDFDLELGSSRGISNEFTDDEAAVSFSDGLLLVILSNEPEGL